MGLIRNIRYRVEGFYVFCYLYLYPINRVASLVITIQLMNTISLLVLSIPKFYNFFVHFYMILIILKLIHFPMHHQYVHYYLRASFQDNVKLNHTIKVIYEHQRKASAFYFCLCFL